MGELSTIESAIVGGANVARLGLEETARLMIDLAHAPKRPERPLWLTSVNGEVLARLKFDRRLAEVIDRADIVNADGQALVFASRLLSHNHLPERVATTDLYPVVARMAQDEGVSFYLLGAREEVNLAAYQATKRDYPRLDLRGRSHGYLRGDALLRKLGEINALAPDILWLSLGVPLEQEFLRLYSHLLPNVKMIKTSGGLLDFVAGAKKRAPVWVQKIGMEWAFRMGMEPRRLLMRYVATNPVAVLLLLTQTR